MIDDDDDGEGRMYVCSHQIDEKARIKRRVFS